MYLYLSHIGSFSKMNCLKMSWSLPAMISMIKLCVSYYCKLLFISILLLFLFLFIGCTCFCLVIAVFHAITITAFIAKSTGTASAVYSELQSMDRSTPLPPAANIPVGPFRLSTQPGRGSLSAGVTAEKHLMSFMIIQYLYNYNTIERPSYLLKALLWRPEAVDKNRWPRLRLVV